MPDSHRLQFGFRLARLARLWRRELDARLAGSGLTDAIWPPLIYIDEAGGAVSQKALAARAGVETSTLVRLLDLLGERGLIRREVSPADRRINLVSLTEAGRVVLEDVRARIAHVEDEMLAGLDDAEIAAALRGFETIERNLGDLRAARETDA